MKRSSSLGRFADGLRSGLEVRPQAPLRVPFYMARGETDIALRNGQQVMAVSNKYGVRNFWVLSTGGHAWANWRRYLHQTAQIMFPEDRKR